MQELLKPIKASSAVGNKVARLPPLVDRIEEMADTRALRNSEVRQIPAGQRESRRAPIAGDSEKLTQALPGDFAFRGQQQN